jgi:hypothetical protein
MLIPVIAVSGLVASVLSGCTSDEGVAVAEADAAAVQSGSGVFSDEYKEKYQEYEAFLKQLFQTAKTKYEAGSLPQDEFFQVRSRYDRARLGMLMLEKGKSPDANPYPFQLIKVKAMQACENDMKKFDFASTSYKEELALYGLMMQYDPAAVEAAAAAVAGYPAAGLTDEQLNVLANLPKSTSAFEAAPAYTARFEELAVKLAAARDAYKAEYDAGKLPEKDLVVITALLDKAHIGLKRLQKGFSARPGLIERFLDVYVGKYLYRLIQEDLQAGKAAYIEAFKVGTDKLNSEALLLKDWRVDDRLMREISALHLMYPRNPLTDEAVDKAVNVRARRAPAEGSYDYQQKIKELVGNRQFLNGFCQAEFGAGRLPMEVFIENAYLWDLDRLALTELEEGSNREPGSIEAVLTLKFNEYLLKNHEAKQQADRKLDNLKINVFEARLNELAKTAPVPESSLKKLRRGLENYPDEPLKENRIKNLLKQKDEWAPRP